MKFRPFSREIYLAIGCVTLLPLISFAGEGLDCVQTSALIQTSLEEKLRSGIPFELLAVTEQNKKPACYRSLQIYRSLWDNRIRISEGETLVGRYPTSEYALAACKNLSCRENLQTGRPALLRVYLNPHWAGRLSRLRARANAMSLLLYTLDWDEIGRQNGGESVLFEKEILP